MNEQEQTEPAESIKPVPTRLQKFVGSSGFASVAKAMGTTERQIMRRMFAVHTPRPRKPEPIGRQALIARQKKARA